MKRSTIITAIVYLFILLFMYTAISKLLAFNVTLFDMGRNPILGNYPLFWTIAVPTAEIIISILLFFPRTRWTGLWATVILMFLFTSHVWALLMSDHELPCTCGGISRELSWWQHLWVNLGLMFLAMLTLVLTVLPVRRE